MNEDKIRRGLEKSLRRPITDAIWKKLVDAHYVLEVENGEPGALAGLINEAKSLERMAREHTLERQSRPIKSSPPIRPGFQTLEAEDARGEAYRRVLAWRIARRPDVKRLRRQIDSGLVPAPIVEREVERVVQQITEDYGLSRDHALTYMSGNADDLPPPIEVVFEQIVGEQATFARLLISFEPWMNEQSIVRAVRRAQDVFLGSHREHRLMSAKIAKVVEWVEFCRAANPSQTFRSIAKEWNDKCDRGQLPKEWFYKYPDTFSRDYRRGEKALLRPKYFDPHPDEQRGLRRTKLLPVAWSRPKALNRGVVPVIDSNPDCNAENL